MPHDLSQFALKDMIECGRALRRSALDAPCMEAAAETLVQFFYSNLVGTGVDERNCALVRCFKTHRFGQLPLDLKNRARKTMIDDWPRPELPCLTLLATAGDLPEWNDRHLSQSHAVIPLENVEIVKKAPMIASLIQQMGLEIDAALYPDPQLILDSEQHTFNVFHVEEALGDSSIPAQEAFVLRHGIRSVLGFGGLLPSGELFVVILFSKVRIARETAPLFRTIALAVKLALLPHTRGKIFEDADSLSSLPDSDVALKSLRDEQLRSETATLQLLLTALEDAALDQTNRLQCAFDDFQVQGELVRSQGASLSAMLEATTDSVFLINRSWEFTFLNGHAKQLISVGRDLVGRNLWELFPEAIDTNFWREYRRAMIEGIDVKFQEYYPEPLDRWFEVHAFPSEDGIAVFFHDVTDRLKTEASLRQTEKLAAAGKLAASLAHEINNPLESITNLLYLVNADGRLAEDTKSYVTLAESELKRISELTTHMLRFHRQSTFAVEVDLVEVLDSVLTLYKGRLEQANIVVIKRFPKVATISGHSGELRQVLANLIGNAVDASRLGGTLVLRARYAKDLRSGVMGVRITVADTGSGMNQTVIAKIFEPFFTTKGITGTGLGLWVTLDLVKKHQGRISVRSSDSFNRHGTVFSVFWPQLPVEDLAR